MDFQTLWQHDCDRIYIKVKIKYFEHALKVKLYISYQPARVVWMYVCMGGILRGVLTGIKSIVVQANAEIRELCMATVRVRPQLVQKLFQLRACA